MKGIIKREAFQRAVVWCETVRNNVQPHPRAANQNQLGVDLAGALHREKKQGMIRAY